MFGTYKLIAIAVVVALIAAYIGFLHLEVGHYKTKAENIEAQYSLIVHTQAIKLAAVEAQVKEQDAARQQQTIKAQQIIDGLIARNQKEIKDNAELRNVVIPELARRLFNNTTDTTDRPDQKGSTGTPDGKDATTRTTLADLLAANEVNKKNYLECSEDKNAWIKLWRETEANLNGTP